MRFTLTAAVLAFAASVLAADSTPFDPIAKPATDETIPAGQTYAIKWTAQPAKNKGDTITIKWYSGTSPETLTEKGNVASRSSYILNTFPNTTDSHPSRNQERRRAVQLECSRNPRW